MYDSIRKLGAAPAKVALVSFAAMAKVLVTPDVSAFGKTNL